MIWYAMFMKYVNWHVSWALVCHCKFGVVKNDVYYITPELNWVWQWQFGLGVLVRLWARRTLEWCWPRPGRRGLAVYYWFVTRTSYTVTIDPSLILSSHSKISTYQYPFPSFQPFSFSRLIQSHICWMEVALKYSRVRTVFFCFVFVLFCGDDLMIS